MGRRRLHAIGVLVALAGCRAEPVPPELIHIWRTQAPAYHDRHLEVRKDLLVFGTGGYMSQLYPIDGIDSEPAEDGSVLYTIHYRAEDGDHLELKVSFMRGHPPSLRIEHIDDVWHADAESGGPETGA